ncbi:hypothetical protein GCM10009785_06430 [Brooklawnia cerclae]|uniref:ATP synthase subunit delta n=1 Tax=Brooklawnia cerclae TaxID=349934 RepID=A0ABX0SDG5_9ACTN|nr:ATP synthase F1 subunit delta [Brooklawnia cerclae]NIH56434.1 F-type H+-transporting ATPase subunit delta [Brooklawnia cerclae]
MSDRLDREIDALGLTAADVQGLFDASDALAAQFRLRATLSDPAIPAGSRRLIAHRLFDGRIPAGAADALAAASAASTSAGELERAVERQAVRVTLMRAASVDAVRDELFHVARLVEADPDLQRTLTDPLVEVPARQALVAQILAGRSQPETLTLADRAVLDRGRTIVRTLDEYVEEAAALRRHQVARVTVATPLTGEQLSRLRTQLTRIYGQGIDAEVFVDPEVVGGVRVEVGDDLIDGTVRNTLDDARRLIS